MRSGQLARKRVAAAVALGHEAARLTGVRAARLPLVHPPTDEEQAALGASKTDEEFDAAFEAYLRYERCVEAVLKRLSVHERVRVAADCLARVADQATAAARPLVDAALDQAARWPRQLIASDAYRDLSRSLHDAGRAGGSRSAKDRRRRMVAMSAGGLARALRTRTADGRGLSLAIGDASRAAVDEAAEVAYQTERLCEALLGGRG